jgi:hypothetical protein
VDRHRFNPADGKVSGIVDEHRMSWALKEAPLYAVRLDKRLTPNRVHVVQEFIVELTRAWHDVFAASSVADADT